MLLSSSFFYAGNGITQFPKEESLMKPNIKTFLVLTLILLFCCAAAHAQTQSQVLFRDTNRKGSVPEKADPTVIRSRNVEVNVSLLEDGAKTITVPLFEGKSVKVDLERSKTQLPPTKRLDYLWNGTIAGQPGSSAVFAVVGNIVTADIITRDLKLYQLRYIGNSVYSLRQIDQSKFENEDDPTGPVKPDQNNGKEDTCDTDPPDQIDVMVVYTDDARAAAGGTEAIIGTIYLAVEQANQSYINSEINLRQRLVDVEEVSYDESGSHITDLERLQNGADGFVDNVQILRNTFAADLVSMIVEANSFGKCGRGNIMYRPSNAFESEAYSVVIRHCASAAANLSYAHETGHNMGAEHNLENAAPLGTGEFSYSHGFRHPSRVAAESWRTIMSYATALSSTRVLYWSNSGVRYPVRDVLMGTDDLQDNARVLNDNARIVANFRCGSPGTANVWMKDNWSDTGVEPNPNTDVAGSPYIWVRNSRDVGLVHQHEHENPLAGPGLRNYVYVKLHNGSESEHRGQLDLRYAAAATGLAWPVDWTPIGGTPVPVTIAPHETKIVEIPWADVPGSVLVPVAGGTMRDSHYCLVAMWMGDPADLTRPLESSIYIDTLENNNVVWRNMNVIDMAGDDEAKADFIFRNVNQGTADLQLAINAPHLEGNRSFFNFGWIEVTFDGPLFELVRKGFKKQAGVKLRGKNFIVTSPKGVVFQNINAPDKFEGNVIVTFRLGKNAPKRMYEVIATEYRQAYGNQQQQDIGSVIYQIYNYKRYDP
jgi:hypothetical protein